MTATDTPKPEGRPREVVLLVGGSSDLGLAIIRRLAPEGPLFLAHCHRSAAKLEALRDTLPGLDLVVLPADLSTAEGLEGFLVQLEAHPAPSRIVYLPAPKLAFIRFKDGAWEDFQKGLDLQLRGLAGVLRKFLPGMARERKGKVVVLLSSVTLNVPQAALAHYVAVKYAMWGLVRALAAEFASRRLNLNAVSPAMVETAFLDGLPRRMVELAAAETPRQQHVTPEEVAAAVAFLLSREADAMTGINLPVTGGASF